MEHLSEVIFIGLPGPTHHYGGLSADNVASSSNKGALSSPKTAALQALALARALTARGITTGLLAPQLRPHLPLLQSQFPALSGAAALIPEAAKHAPALLEKASASSAMWSANAATISPTADNRDGLLHLTTANLHTNLHRRIEAADTHALLAAIFASVPSCAVHEPLPATMPDEGAANHMRLGNLNVFVHSPVGRQSLAASQAIAEQHTIEHALFIEQNPEAIAHGVFHNDVISVSNGNVLLMHEDAFADKNAHEQIAAEYQRIHGQELIILTVTRAALSMDEAVGSYLFNSQIVTRSDGKMTIIAPQEVGLLYGGKAAALLENIKNDPGNPIDEIVTLDLRQSMRNGGGPACLRLRVPMTSLQLEALRKSVNVIVDDALLKGAEAIIERYYPDELSSADLANPAIYDNCKAMRAQMLTLMQLKTLTV